MNNELKKSFDKANKSIQSYAKGVLDQLQAEWVGKRVEVTFQEDVGMGGEIKDVTFNVTFSEVLVVDDLNFTYWVDVERVQLLD